VREKVLRDATGRTVRVLSLDANSATFSDDLTEVFARNVARARRENKRLFGSASGLGVKRATYSDRLKAARTKAARAGKNSRANGSAKGIRAAKT
jgi:hypothetical protein